MCADVNYGVCLENLFEIGIERRETMMRRSALRHQQPHRVIFITKSRLDADEDLTEMKPLN